MYVRDQETKSMDFEIKKIGGLQFGSEHKNSHEILSI